MSGWGVAGLGVQNLRPEPYSPPSRNARSESLEGTCDFERSNFLRVLSRGLGIRDRSS